MTSPKRYDGCFCGAVQFTVTGEPVSMGIVIAIRAAIGRRLPLMRGNDLVFRPAGRT
jgi:hypothetical protein